MTIIRLAFAYRALEASACGRGDEQEAARARKAARMLLALCPIDALPGRAELRPAGISASG